MALENVLLVTRNYRGQSETNFLSTIDEFVETWCTRDGPEIADGIKKVITGAKPFKWDGNYYVRGDDSLDMRLCQGEDDLINFLEGKFNDSIGEMEARNPGTAGCYDSWCWENSADFCSVMAVDAVKNYILQNQAIGANFKEKLMNAMPDFPFEKAKEFAKAPSLDDVIKAAKQKQSTSSKTHSPTVLEI